ncbi:hypothetical protein OKJ48_06125 [Streptomyces kunmingensis]|uniref:DUF7144 domain-containing protein n=1 Tax=Streptomyces kunmingensis TaxID=68225 RepID=A0ABU6C527_9ACTN|nr:hypothetical protein [Streptomyces kunmingensis]MEB3959828.1 hypothetical protein [Streptomyces kunmingensis]
MTDQISRDPAPPGAPEPEPHVNPLAVGGVVFAVCLMVIIGSYHTIAGLSAILGDNYYQAQNDYAFDFDVNGRGWVQMISGFIVLVAALNLFAGRVWARAAGILVAMFSALENFFFTPYQPVWSAIIIALDVLVIWSLAMYGHQAAHRVYGSRK